MTIARKLALAAGGEAAVLLGDRQPEVPELGQAGDHVLGDVVVLAVDVLGHGPHLVLGEAAEGVLHQLEVGVEVARALLAGQRREELGAAVRAHEGDGAVEGPGLDPPRGLSPEQARAPRRARRRRRRRRRSGASTSPCSP